MQVSSQPWGRFLVRFLRVVGGAVVLAAVTGAIGVVAELPSFVPGSEAVLVSGVLTAVLVALDKYLREVGVY